MPKQCVLHISIPDDLAFTGNMSYSGPNLFFLGVVDYQNAKNLKQYMDSHAKDYFCWGDYKMIWVEGRYSQLEVKIFTSHSYIVSAEKLLEINGSLSSLPGLYEYFCEVISDLQDEEDTTDDDGDDDSDDSDDSEDDDSDSE